MPCSMRCSWRPVIATVSESRGPAGAWPTSRQHRQQHATGKGILKSRARRFAALEVILPPKWPRLHVRACSPHCPQPALTCMFVFRPKSRPFPLRRNTPEKRSPVTQTKKSPDLRSPLTESNVDLLLTMDHCWVLFVQVEGLDLQGHEHRQTLVCVRQAPASAICHSICHSL